MSDPLKLVGSSRATQKELLARIDALVDEAFFPQQLVVQARPDQRQHYHLAHICAVNRALEEAPDGGFDALARQIAFSRAWMLAMLQEDGA